MEVGKMADSALLERLVETTKDYPSWSVLRRAVEAQKNIHLAVMIEPYLTYILEGKKTIESRFSKHAIAPFYQIEPGELVLLKLTGGPVVGCFMAGSVEFLNLDDRERTRLRQDYSEAICADAEFWKAREDKRYATLVGVQNARDLRSAPVAKSDRRGWIVLKSAGAHDGFEQLTLV
jgi:hypothetical protein